MPKILRRRFTPYPVNLRSANKPTISKESSAPKIQEERLVVIDTDAGTDDAWALFMCLAAHQDEGIPFKIQAITCTFGNTTVDNVTKNVTRTLQTVNETTIPVYRGAENPLTVRLVHENYHGEDGFGDADLPPVEAVLETEHAVNAIIRLSEEFKGLLTILVLGPLTNLALAIRLKPEIASNFKEIVILGGNSEGVGNTTPGAEFNFLSDVEAACTALENYTCPITVVPWETCVKFATSTHTFRTDELGILGTEKITLLNAIEANILEMLPDSWLAPDAAAAAVLIEPRLTLGTEFQYCTVELQGFHTRGMMVVDRNGFLGLPANVKLVMELDLELYQRMLIWAAGGPYYLPDTRDRLPANPI